MSRRLRELAGRLADVRDRASDPALVEAIENVIAEAMTEILTLDSSAQELAKIISNRQERELVALYGPTSFNRAHLDPRLIAEEIRSADLL